VLESVCRSGEREKSRHESSIRPKRELESTDAKRKRADNSRVLLQSPIDTDDRDAVEGANQTGFESAEDLRAADSRSVVPSKRSSSESDFAKIRRQRDV